MKKTIATFSIIFLMAGILATLHAVQQTSELRKEVIKINYINLYQARDLARKFLTGKGKLEIIIENNILIVEDIPEVVDKIVSLLREIDIKSVDLEFRVDLILGSTLAPVKEANKEIKEKTDKELNSDPLIKQLKSLLKYSYFQRLDSSIIKVQDNSISSQRLGSEGLSFKLRLHPRYIKEGSQDTYQVELRLSQHKGFNPEGKEISLTLIDTTFHLKSGERTVVGVSKLDGGDKALILILSGKVIK